jgi:anti-sigma regulatory factor (Ser/Thr protein kinase)
MTSEYGGALAGGPVLAAAPPVACGAAAAGVRELRVFPGDARQLGVLRKWIAGLLPAGPVRDDVAIVATELGSNAIRHSASGCGGTFEVELAFTATAIRVAVADGGGPGRPRVIAEADGEYGRGLLLVAGLAECLGADGGPGGRVVWAQIAREDR